MRRIYVGMLVVCTASFAADDEPCKGVDDIALATAEVVDGGYLALAWRFEDCRTSSAVCRVRVRQHRQRIADMLADHAGIVDALRDVGVRECNPENAIALVEELMPMLEAYLAWFDAKYPPAVLRFP